MKQRRVVVGALALGGALTFVVLYLIVSPHSGELEVEHRTYEVLIDPETKDPQYMLHRPLTIKIGPDNNIYILDQGNGRIMVYDRNMKFVRQIGRVGQGPGEFIEPTDFDIDAEGNIYVAEFINRRISVLNPDGSLKKSFWVKRVIPQNWQLAVNGDRHIYVSTFDDSLISVFNIDGVELFRFGSLFQHPEVTATRHYWNTVFLDTDQNDNLWVLYETRPLVRCYTKSGHLIFEKEVNTPAVEQAKKQERPMPPLRTVLYFHDLSCLNSGRVFISNDNFLYELNMQGDVVKIYSVNYPPHRENGRYQFVHRIAYDQLRDRFLGTELMAGMVFKF